MEGLAQPLDENSTLSFGRLWLILGGHFPRLDLMLNGFPKPQGILRERIV
jgi:hypothetical protein